MTPFSLSSPSSLLTLGAVCMTLVAHPALAEQPLFLAYPPANHETTSDRIFLIGTAPLQGDVLVNGRAIARSAAGHFAPSFPLNLGENSFTLRYGNQELTLKVIRVSTEPAIPDGLAFAKDSLTPAVDIARLPNESICFGAVAPPKATVSVKLADQTTIPLAPQAQRVDLPSNLSVLTQQDQPTAISATRNSEGIASSGYYKGCTRTLPPGDFGKPEFQLTLDGKTTRQTGPGSVKILAANLLSVAEVTAENGVARTGPSTDHSRLTPLPKGTQATITGYEGDWVRLDYGAWINRKEVQIRESSVPPATVIRGARAIQRQNWTDIVFPLQVPVPVSVQQGDRTFTLTLHNTTAQTDIIKLDDDPLIERLDWQQAAPGQVQYTFNLKTSQQWGYTLRYEGTSLVLSLRHPLGVRSQTSRLPLAGVKVLLDPGHGGPEDLGSRGPTGYPEKAVALIISKLVQAELLKRGATVVMTREADQDVSLQDRVNLITKEQPTIALSLHYNALPDSGDAIKTQGVAAFWFHSQAHSLAVALHNHLVKALKRPSYGVFWNNLALTRPAIAPSVLLELGFMINPDEFEWITNPREQQRLAVAIADGITNWVQANRSR